jgi:hypothetical protein
MSRLHLLTNYDDMTINKKEEGYVRVLASVSTGVCGDVRVFWNHRHIVICARNSHCVNEISNDDQRMTVAPRALLRSSFDGRRAGSLR